MTCTNGKIGSFWSRLARPILGLSPMDGITNAPYRFITAKYGRPDVVFTEFVPVEGLMHAATRLLRDFAYDEIERPVVAQIYGSEPQAFYAVAHLVCELGFDGIDINMGCPAKNVASRGAGAGLIRTPALAQEIVRAVRRGIHDWCQGQDAAQAGVPVEVVAAAEPEIARHRAEGSGTRVPIPVSVKTRIGFDTVSILDWVRALLDVEPAVISIHGRTLKQLYRGTADWDAIAAAADAARGTSTCVLGNGDLQSAAAIAERVRATPVAGVLVGRASMGNPWIFASARAAVARGSAAEAVAPTVAHRLAVLLDHAAQLESGNAGKAFPHLYRLIKPYTHGIPEAAALRAALMAARSAQEMAVVVQQFHAATALTQDHLSLRA